MREEAYDRQCAKARTGRVKKSIYTNSIQNGGFRTTEKKRRRLEGKAKGFYRTWQCEKQGTRCATGGIYHLFPLVWCESENDEDEMMALGNRDLH